MIEDTLTTKKTPAITSNRWHVVQACWTGTQWTRPPFARRIVSEHDDRNEAVLAAEGLLRSLALASDNRPVAERDQIFVRPPNFKTLKFARRRKTRRD